MNPAHLLLCLAFALGPIPAFADSGHSHSHSHSHHHAKPTPGVDMGGPGKAADVKRTIRIETRDRDYNLRQIQVRPGETVRFVVVNKSSIRHEFGIARRAEHVEHRKMMEKMPDMKHDDPELITVEPGETKELIWRFGTHKDALKDLEFACNIPGHAEQGMEGKFRGL
jgi:uncharacterized cupredoxin-like copper-binding protein